MLALIRHRNELLLMKHILMVDHVSDLGGAELSMDALVTCMPTSQYHYTVTLPGDGPMVERLRSRGLAVKTLPLESWRWWVQTRTELLKFILTLPLQFVSLLRWVRLLRTVKPDLVHFNINRLVEPILAARLLRIPSVMHFRDLPSCMKLRFVLGRRGFYAIMNLATYWIANSTATKHDIQSHAKRSVRKIPNGIDLTAFDQKANSGECEYAKASLESFTVAMVSLLVPMKNHAAYLSLAKNLLSKRNDVVFLVAGCGELKYSSELQRLACDLGIGEKVKFLGHVNNVPALLRDVDLLVHTSDYESFGRVFIEAMAARKPVVAFDCGGAAEIVVNEETGVLVPPGKLGEMAKAVGRLLDDPLLRQRMGEAGRSRVEQHFTLEKHCREVAEVYDQLLAEVGR